MKRTQYQKSIKKHKARKRCWECKGGCSGNKDRNDLFQKRTLEQTVKQGKKGVTRFPRKQAFQGEETKR